MKLSQLLAILAYGIVIHQAACAQMIPEDGINQKINSLVFPLVETKNFAGTIAISKDGELIFSEAYGKSRNDRIPNTLSSNYFLASSSMIFTSLAILKLVESDVLSLDDKLSKYYPDFVFSDSISIHHLLTEQSGIPSPGGLRYASMIGSPQTIETLISYIDKSNIEFSPGTSYSHSRSSYILLAGIIEKVSGQSFGSFLQDEIFEPLGMISTGHFNTENILPDIQSLLPGWMASGFDELEQAPVIHWSSKTGHASIYSNAQDMLKLGNAIMSKILLSEMSWNMILKDYGGGVGYGIFIRHVEKESIYILNGRSPGYNSFIYIDPKERLVVVMLSNIYNSITFFTAPKIADIALGKPVEITRLSSKPVEDDLVSEWLGTYQFGSDFYNPNGKVQITFKDGHLWSDGAAMIPVMNENGDIVKWINRKYWSTLVFEEMETGAIVLKFDGFNGKRSSGMSTVFWIIFACGILLAIIIFRVYIQRHILLKFGLQVLQSRKI